ncbi:MAG: hypothetical protein ABIQ01_09315 [Pseudolysinimonas sp.]
MSGRTVAVVEWVLGALLVAWFATFVLLNGNLIALGPTISSLFFAPGLAISLGINGAFHFRRRDRLAVSEHVMLGIELLVVILLVAASISDQVNYGANVALGSSFGHWLEWFLPPWLVIGPVALTILILGIVKRKPAIVQTPAPAAEVAGA